MGRIILGAIAGFIIWTILLLCSDAVWLALAPDWYGKHQAALQEAVSNKTEFMADTLILIIAGIRSAILSIMTGFIAALMAKENFKSPVLLGILLIAFGLFIHSMILNNVPFWYHLLILLPLIPMTVLGGKLRKA
jgi:cytochrome b